jgi:hypothetical protein
MVESAEDEVLARGVSEKVVSEAVDTDLNLESNIVRATVALE